MIGFLNDSEERRLSDRIRGMSYCETRDEMIARTGDLFITRQWISEKLHRDESGVRRTWTKTTEECYTRFGSGRPKILSQEGKNIVASASGVRGNSSRKIAREILEKTEQCVSEETVRREHHQQGLEPFHMIEKPLKTNMHHEDRKWHAEYVVQGISLIA